MRRILNCGAAILSRVVFIGFGIQIVLGILWMWNAFAALQEASEGIICVGQLLLAAAAAYFFLHGAGMRQIWQRVFGVLAIITFPMNMQCHMAVGIRSVCSSVLLLMVSGIIYVCRQKRIWYQLILAAAAGGIISLAVLYLQEERSITGCIASRFAWSTLWNTYDSWTEECREQISIEQMRDSSYEAAGIKEIMLPQMVEAVGKKETDRLLMEISKTAWRQHASVLLKQMTWDAAGYTLPPIIVPMQLKGRAYDSYTGANYRQLLQSAPRLGKMYMGYGCRWFTTGLAVTALLLLCNVRGANLRWFGTAFLAGALPVFLYTMRGAGQMDYRDTGYLLCVWLAVMVSAAGRGMELPGGESDGEMA